MLYFKSLYPCPFAFQHGSLALTAKLCLAGEKKKEATGWYRMPLPIIVQQDMKQDRSTYEVLQVLSISLTDKANLRELFSKTKFQYDKERTDLNGPNLFNF